MCRNTVVDFSTVVSGPMRRMIPADLGANSASGRGLADARFASRPMRLAFADDLLPLVRAEVQQWPTVVLV